MKIQALVQDMFWSSSKNSDFIANPLKLSHLTFKRKIWARTFKIYFYMSLSYMLFAKIIIFELDDREHGKLKKSGFYVHERKILIFLIYRVPYRQVQK